MVEEASEAQIKKIKAVARDVKLLNKIDIESINKLEASDLIDALCAIRGDNEEMTVARAKSIISSWNIDDKKQKVPTETVKNNGSGASMPELGLAKKLVYQKMTVWVTYDQKQIDIYKREVKKLYKVFLEINEEV